MSTYRFVLLLLLILALILLGPLLLIWALNTLFPVLNIPFTVETWLAAFIISATISYKAK